jgi:hypothetical protein
MLAGRRRGTVNTHCIFARVVGNGAGEVGTDWGRGAAKHLTSVISKLGGEKTTATRWQKGAYILFDPIL